ncbi:hypothetical protein EJ06DRAFT_543827 [Trichodelitschia bisporula]|uniref:CCZ1/INTU/HSP4 first Longin domain-containing protein n=1 Tax=Trichodelitschia bisporula TaxID=703511 RepID=A0A6G1HTF1_9PEZI|nr:hypothetical protein EJ06DRAFT_543827 [Trichodelitschia bisporula]
MASEARVVPAQLAFLAIYNPALGPTDETFRDQIVYYYDRTTRLRRRTAAKKNEELERQLQEEENERLRQIGLAQGMVGFARGFSNGRAVDSIDTEKSRIVMHELESGWWIIAQQSIDLTRIPVPASTPTKSAEPTAPTIEYSARELLRAHSIFLLHNGTSLYSMYSRHPRPKFCNLLERFWNRFAGTWDVLLHGNPAVDIYGGLQLAAGGELGVGVGEEEWGSGEREVLEDFAQRTEGLVDLVVARFDEPSEAQRAQGTRDAKSKRPLDAEPWMGTDRPVQAADGVIFSGVGAISRNSLRDVSHWVQWVYAYGEQAYGVKENPGSTRRKPKKRIEAPKLDKGKERADKRSADTSTPTLRSPPPGTSPPGIPRPIVSAAENSLASAISAAEDRRAAEPQESEGWMKYLTLGYGSGRGNKPSSADNTDDASDRPMQTVPPNPEPDIDELATRLQAQLHLEDNGHFVIGLKGPLDENITDPDPASDSDSSTNTRIPVRTLYIELPQEAPTAPSPPSPFESGQTTPRPTPSPPGGPRSRLRVLIYAHRPFIYTFLFDPHTPPLSYASFYKSLHAFFAPLHAPLAASTSAERAAARMAAAQGGVGGTEQVFDLLYDPVGLGTRCSIPNIPLPGTLVVDGGWSRQEALGCHAAVVEVARGAGGVLERSVKTGRGWWVTCGKGGGACAEGEGGHTGGTEE